MRWVMLLIGFLSSAAIHGGLIFGPMLWERLFGAQAVEVVQSQAEVVELYVPPPLPEEPPDPAEQTDEPAVDVSTIAPPSLMAVPGTVQVDSFTTSIPPPPPPSLGAPGSQVSIPSGPPVTHSVRSDIGQVFRLEDLDQQPVVRGVRQAPVYPFEMKRNGINGEVTLQFIVDLNGTVRDVEVIKSTHREFEKPAMDAVYKWRFRAGRKGGKAVSVRMQVPINFTLSDDE
jgi:protein TonB